MKNWNEFLASFGLWSLVEDISDDGDGEGDDLQLTEDGEIFVSEITQELERAREEEKKKVLKDITLQLWARLKTESFRIANGRDSNLGQDIMELVVRYDKELSNLEDKKQ